jgi:cytochrome c556
MGSRVKDKGEWITMTRAMMDAASVALKATETRDVEGLFASGEAINVACDACHQKYQTP